jgi:UDP-N-acetylmuramoyl-tripeptide--D-alanyl-D-alanine ligase
MLTLEFFIEALSGQRPPGDIPVASVVIDSRKVIPGGVFFAIKGENTDGHNFVSNAFEAGAIAAFIDHDIPGELPTLDLRNVVGASHGTPLQPPICIRVDSTVLALQEAARQWFRRFNVRTIGITGSVGKSTTKEVIAEVLAQRYKVLKSEGGYNNEPGIPLTIFNLTEQHERAVLEMSMYTIGEIALLTSIAPPDVGVVTLIAPVHLERAGSLENIVKAKTELVEALPAAPDGIAVLNMDDELVMSMTQHTQARIVTYGLNPQADFRATDIEGLGLDGIRFTLHHEGNQRQFHLRMLGRHSVHMALCAAAVAHLDGLNWEEIARGLTSQRGQLRLVAVRGPNGSIILDDTYNASPSSTIAALNLLNDIMEGRRIAVLGDMLELGSYEEIGHAKVGTRAAAVCDLLITIGQRGRIIAREAVASGMPKEYVRAVDTAEEATALILPELHPGDSVLVKGSRAVHMERIVERLNLVAKQQEGEG